MHKKEERKNEGVAMADERRRFQTTEMIEEYGKQLRACLEIAKGDRERENIAASFGQAFQIHHALQY